MIQFQQNRLLSEFSTFGIGGPIAFFAEIHTVEEMEEAFHFVREKKLSFFILGKGSNSLFDDRGFEGVVLWNRIDFCHWEEHSVYVGAGYSFSLLGAQSARRALSGLEFASGIPASVGGAVFMNAGANGRETQGSLQSTVYLHASGEQREYKKEELSFGYRSSSFQSMKGAILAATFSLTHQSDARQRQLQIIDYRMQTQPLKEKSAGCVFRNPPGIAAGALIDQCGLKGLSAGGAKISEVHANFIVNVDRATARDVLCLIQLVQKRVYEKTGIQLEPEIRIFAHDS